MARIPYLTRDQLAPEDRDVLKRDINLYRVLSHDPKTARAFLGLATHIRNGGVLDSRLREMVILQVGLLTGSPYEYSHHVKIGADVGVTSTDVERLVAETRGSTTDLEPVMRVALKAAREMTDARAISNGTFELLRPFFSPAQLVELVVVIAFYNGVVRVLSSLEVDVEEEYAPYLGQEFHSFVEDQVR
jgi:alkylhydroperoxidase family enzyme